MNKEWVMTDIMEINYSASEGVVVLEFYDHSKNSTITTTFKDVLFFKISNTSGDMKTTLIADITIVKIYDMKLKGLIDMGYDFIDVGMMPPVFYKLHAEGSCVLDLIATDCFLETK